MGFSPSCLQHHVPACAVIIWDVPGWIKLEPEPPGPWHWAGDGSSTGDVNGARGAQGAAGVRLGRSGVL